jgi:hypothetical protein
VREQLVWGGVWVGEAFDGKAIGEGDQRGRDLFARGRELQALVAGDALDDAPDEGSEASVALGELGGRLGVADGLVPALVSLLGRWNWWLPAWAARPLGVTPSAAAPEPTTRQQLATPDLTSTGG